MSGAGRVEHRCYTRFTVNAPATIWRDNVTVAGQVTNMSLGGAFIRVHPALLMHEAVTVTIHESARPPGLTSDLPATVVRCSETGCAVRFDGMLLERGLGDALNGRPFGSR
jgi:hypothetical protein